MNKTDVSEDHIQDNAIQAPESDYLYVKPSQIENAGKGLFTAVDIYEDEVISLFKGEILSSQVADLRVAQGDDQYFIILLNGQIMDSKHVDCYAKYANDAEGFSKGSFKNNAMITLDDEDNVCIMATRYIETGEEVFCGYGKPYWKKHG
ncbi:MAG: SET domain-containing protein [Saprospiraceae bacterium]